MAKTKSARLSLTMPPPPQTASNLVRSPTSSGTLNRRSTDASKRGHDAVNVMSGLMDDLSLQSPFQVDDITPHRPNANPHPANPDHPKSPSSPRSPTFTSLPPFPTSPQHTPKHARDPSRSFFANLKASKSSAKIQSPESTIRKVPREASDDSMKWLKKAKSSPDFAKDITTTEPVPDIPVLNPPTPNEASTASHRPIPAAMQSTVTFTGDASDTHDSRRKGNSTFANLMKRNHSTRFEDSDDYSKPSTPAQIKYSDPSATKTSSRDRSAGRNTSPYSESGDFRSAGAKGPRFTGRQLNYKQSQTFRDGGSNLLNGFKEKTSKGFEGIGKAGNRFFKGKPTMPQPNQGPGRYELQVINLPLAEQTRQTRIAQRLEDSKDKTEFWMPALPWRCIDYLNFNGCEAEGIYRVPGGATQINEYKQRFDTEFDVNLFDQPDLYDVNTIASVLKAWLLGLPDEILPRSTQDEITEKHAGEEGAPQMLKDELSKLPPFNYYLLFAITCHLSLLQAYVDKNKMDINALSVCFTIPLKMNRVCLRWLVKDWRNCWQGCWTEKAYLDEEYRILAQEDVEGGEVSAESADEPLVAFDDQDRSLSSAGSAKSTQKAGTLTVNTHPNDHLYPPTAQSNGHHGRSASQLPALAPFQPLSPIFPEHPVH